MTKKKQIDWGFAAGLRQKDFPEEWVLLPRRNVNTGLVCGVGCNDAPYLVEQEIGGVRVRCPIYQMWGNMLGRVYRPTAAQARIYAGCSVASEWLSFMAFRSWILQQPDYANRQIDKDLLVAGNRIYSPQTCVMLPKAVNTLLTNRQDGDLPQGVWRDGRKYAARLATHGNTSRHLGIFATVAEASECYYTAKQRYLVGVAQTYLDEPTIHAALIDAAAFIKDTYIDKSSYTGAATSAI